MGHTAWQPDSRIVTRKKLWKSLEASVLSIPMGKRLDEHPVRSPMGIKYFSAIHCASYSPLDLVTLMSEERATTLVYVRSEDVNDVVVNLVMQGWEKSPIGPPQRVLSLLCEKDFVIHSLMGEFDDAEAGAFVLGRTNRIKKLFQIE